MNANKSVNINNNNNKKKKWVSKKCQVVLYCKPKFFYLFFMILLALLNYFLNHQKKERRRNIQINLIWCVGIFLRHPKNWKSILHIIMFYYVTYKLYIMIEEGQSIKGRDTLIVLIFAGFNFHDSTIKRDCLLRIVAIW